MRGGGLRRRDYHSTGNFEGGELSSGVGRFSTGAPVCWGFWARGPGYPYGILELGS